LRVKPLAAFSTPGRQRCATPTRALSTQEQAGPADGRTPSEMPIKKPSLAGSAKGGRLNAIVCCGLAARTTAAQTSQRLGATALGSGTALTLRKTDFQALSSSFPLPRQPCAGCCSLAPSRDAMGSILIHKNNQR